MNSHIHDLIYSITPRGIRYYRYFKHIKGRYPNLFFPKDYCDYIFQDNFWGNHDKHAYLADKYRVREYVESKGLSILLTKLYGVWEHAEDIDFNLLPNQFALKCNHSCGMNIICYDKSKLDIPATINQLNSWLSSKHPRRHERHYYKIKPMIICEELIPNNRDGFFPMDYKIHCANGRPVFVQCCLERSAEDEGKRVIYSTSWEDLHYVIQDKHYTKVTVERPKHLPEMLEYASILSEGLRYARIDLYDTDDRVIFREITLTPMGGWLTYFKQEALDLMGREIRKK